MPARVHGKPAFRIRDPALYEEPGRARVPRIIRHLALPARASLYYLKDDKTIDYVPDEESIAAFKERAASMIAAVCAGEFPARASYMGCRNCDYKDLCETARKNGE